MLYTVYHKDTTRHLDYSKPYYRSMRSAKIALTKAVNRGEVKREDYAVCDYDVFQNTIEKFVTRKNLLSGKEYQERVNTPSYCSPASEAYHSM